MANTAGTLSQVSVSSTSDVLSSAVTTGGTTPYTYQWYRSTTSGFTPGTGTSISGATSLSLSDSGLTPGTVYYYKVVSTDSNATPVLATSAQLTVTTTAAALSQNQFNLSAFLGVVDLRINPNIIDVQFDPAGSGTLVAGQAVKWSTASGGAPLVVPSTATADVIAGFVVYDIKSASYAAGDRLQIAMTGSTIYLYAALAVNRGVQVTSLPSGVAGGCNGGVVPALGGSIPISGIALDTAAIGSLFRVQVATSPATTG